MSRQTDTFQLDVGGLLRHLRSCFVSVVVCGAMGLRRTGLLLLIIPILRFATVHSTAERMDVDEEDTDSVPYMIVVEHADGRRCAGALVSLRMALSSVRCARPRTSRAPLWALAAALVTERGSVRATEGARRVVRLAFAGTAADISDSIEELALLALDEPFGESAHSRPILMATSAGDCDAASECNTVHALPRLAVPSGSSLRLRVLSANRVPPAVCAAHLLHWAAAKESSLCLKGKTLCESDLGGGVVCAGLLCGVLSALGDSKTEKSERATCGQVFAALAVARRRRFLHCAHTQRLCGIGDCKSLCTEQWLEVESEGTSAASASPAPQTSAVAAGGVSLRGVTDVGNSSSQGLPQQQRGSFSKYSVPPDSVPSRTPLFYEVRHAADFEPNRADFKSRSSSARTVEATVSEYTTELVWLCAQRARASLSTPALSSVRLKAGEYGDNAADYGAPPDDALPPARRTPPRLVALRPAASASRSVTSQPASTSPRADWLDPLAQPQTDAHENAVKTSDAPSRHIQMMLLITITPFAIINGYETR